MDTFGYVARDKKGKVIRGVLEAPSQDELVATLQSRGLLITSVVSQKGAKVSKRKVRGRFHTRVKIDDLALLARQLATLLGAGITLLKALEIVGQQIESRRLASAIEGVRRDIEAGSSFRDALARHPRMFSDFWMGIVETGESSGQLPSILDQLSKYLESAMAFQRKTVSALVYPAVLVFAVIMVLTIFTTRIIPTFSEIFESFEVPLPLITTMIISLSKFLREKIGYIFLFLVGLGYVTSRYIRTKSGRWMFDQLKLKLPVFGSLFHQVALARFARGLTMLVSSGVPLLYALEISARSATNKVFVKALEDVKTGVRDGKTMAGPLGKNALFPPMVVQMVNVGEETGKLGEMLSRTADYYEERVEAFVTRLTSMFEPILLIVMGVIVGILVISMFLPIFSVAQLGGLGR